MQSNKAFTLIEILITLSITFILLFISISSFKHLYLQTSDDVVRNQLIHAIQFAKNESRVRYQSIGLCKSENYLNCSGNWEDGQIVFLDKHNDGKIHNTNDILLKIDMPLKHGKLYWREFPVYRDYVVFSPASLLQSDNGTFWYCNTKSLLVWAIVLNKSGNLRIAYPDKNGVIKDGEDKPLKCKRD